MPIGTIIDGCCNIGELLANGYAPRIGGISASPEDNCIIRNCYNSGTIKTTENSSVIRVGGIVGDVFSQTTLNNCYNIGIFEIRGSVSTKGSIYANMKGNIDNCYYIKQEGFEMGGNANTSTITNSDVKTSDEMKKEDFVNLLNKNWQKFKIDNNDINNGYPVLDWQ